MRTTKKELKKIIQEEYQKVLEEYIPEGGAEGHYAKMRSQEKPTPDPYAITTIDKIRELLGTLETTLGAASVAEGVATPELEPEAWYGKESPEDTGKGASFELGLFIVKLDKIQPGLGGELDKILAKLDAEEQAPSRGLEEELDPATEEALVRAIQANPKSSWLLSQDDPCKLGEAIKAIADKLDGEGGF